MRQILERHLKRHEEEEKQRLNPNPIRKDEENQSEDLFQSGGKKMWMNKPCLVVFLSVFHLKVKIVYHGEFSVTCYNLKDES